MRISLGNPAVKILLSICGFVLLFGSVFSTINNAKSLITPTVTYVLTGILVMCILLIMLLEIIGGLKITYPDGSRFSIVGVRPLVVIAALLIIIWLPRAFSPASDNNLGITTQRGVLELQGTKTYEVFYPKPFSSIPNLTFSKKIENQYYSVNYEVMEQRKDGFKINITFTSNPGAIEWWAEGVIDKNASPNK
jgi:uncharacterized membrane protein